MNWQFDLLSFLLGIIVGVALLLMWQKTRPFWRKQWQQLLRRGYDATARLRTGAEQRFLNDTIQYAQSYHLGRQHGTLDCIYVAPRFLAPQPLGDLEQKPPASVQLNYIWPDLAASVATPPVPEMSLSQLLLNGQRVIVTGEPGAGKTTLLAYVAYLCAAAAQAESYPFLLHVVPVFAHLSELNLADNTADPLLPLIQALQQRGSALGRSGIGNLLRHKVKVGNLLLLLDGWDELQDEKTAVFQWLQQLFTTYPALRALITADLTGFGPLLSLNFTWTTLRPWRLPELEAFAAHWAKAIANNPLAPDRYWLPGRTAQETTLRFWLVAQGTLPAATFQPQRHYDLFAQYLTQFMGEVAENAPQRLLEPFWQRLAYTLLAEKKLSLTADEVAALAAETLTQKAGQVELSTVKALQKATAKSVLFVQNGNGSLRFLNSVWRDLLAAGHLVQHGLAYAAENHIRDEAWAGALRFYVAQTDAVELVKKALKSQVSSPMRDELFRVASWLPEVKELGEWRQQTLILLGQLTRQRTFAQVLRLRAAAALVQTGQPGTMAFVQQLLERSDAFLRQAGVVALSHLGQNDPQRVVEMLHELLADGDGVVRETAVSALAWLGLPAAEKPLLAALLEGDDHMRRAAAMGLARNGTPGQEILREATEDEDLRVRRAAAYGLALLEAEWVEPLLMRLERKDREWVVRAAASEALEQMRARQKPAPWEPLPPRGVRWLADYALEEGRSVPEGKAALPFLVQVMSQARKPAVRAAAALTLGQLLDQEAIPALETAVQDQQSEVQDAAFATLCLARRAFK